MKLKHADKIIGNERGMVLVVSVLLIATLMILGTTAIMTSTTDIRISSNYRASNEAFYIAEAGVEAAREQLRQAAAAGTPLSTLLAAACGTDGVLTDSADFANFYDGGNFVSDDVPYLAASNFGAGGTGSYRVYLTNDAAEGVTNTTDGNESVTLTAFGFGPQGSMVVVQEVVKKMLPFNLPGAIVLPGPNVNFQFGSSGPQNVDGGAMPAIAVDSGASLATVTNDISGLSSNKQENVECAAGTGTACVQNSTLGYPWNSQADIMNLYNALRDIATCRPPAACTMGTSMSDIVVLDGNPTFSGSDHGYGILVVNGSITLSGNVSFDGLILVVGNGSITREGGGNGTIKGSIVAANTNGGGSTLSIPTYSTNGGGTSSIAYDSGSLTNGLKFLPYVRTSWRQSGLD